jgi:hypothetical protein
LRAVPGWESWIGQRQNGKWDVNDRQEVGYGELADDRVPIWDKYRKARVARDCRNWRVSASLIRNLEEVFWFGTQRVLEENRKTGNWEWELGI